MIDKKALLLLALALTVAGNVLAYSPASVSETPEAQSAFKALRTIEIKIGTGMNLAEYRQEVAIVAVAIEPFGMLLLTRHQDTEAGHLAHIENLYVLASKLWSACVQDSFTRYGCTLDSIHKNMMDLWTEAKDTDLQLQAELTGGAQ